MEIPEIRKRKIKQERRKEKGDRVDSSSPEGEGESPPAKKRKVRKSSSYEDIIDGFAIRSFKTYEDLQRAVALESGQPQTENESQESGARISGSGSGDNSKVGSNESPRKLGKSSASTKSPKIKKKKLSTTDQENTAVMQPDLSRCSGESGDRATGNPSTGNILEPGMSESLNASHSHSFSRLQQTQQQQQQFPLSEAVTTLKPHPQHPKKPRPSKEPRKNYVYKGQADEGDNELLEKSSEDHKELFGSARKDLLGRPESVDNPRLHQNLLKHTETSTQQNSQGIRVPSISTSSTSTSLDHSQILPPSSLHLATSSSTVATQFSSPHLPHFQNHQKTPSALHHRSSLAGPSPSPDLILLDRESSKSENGKTSASEETKYYANGPLSPSKRQLEQLNGRNHHHPHHPYILAQPVLTDNLIEGASHQPSPHNTSQAAFTPLSQPSPKQSANSNSLHPAQQQVVAPVSNPKEKFGQGRIGSQTLFTPYATTAITRVRSPQGGGPPPSAPNAISGSQSVTGAAAVLQPESPKEITPLGSPFPSAPHHHQHHQTQQHHNNFNTNHNIQHHLPQPPPNHLHQHSQQQPVLSNHNIYHNPLQTYKNNQHQNIYNNRINKPQNSFGNSQQSNSYGASVHISSNTYPSGEPSARVNQQHFSQNSAKPFQNSVDRSNHNSTGSLHRPQLENANKKERTTPEAFDNKSRPTVGNSRTIPPPQHQKSTNSLRNEVPVPASKSNASQAFGSIARLLDSPTSSSAASHSSSAKNSHQFHSTLPHSSSTNHPHQHHTYSHSNSTSGVPAHSRVSGNSAFASATQSIQHPGSSSSSGSSNSGVSTIPVNTTSISNNQGGSFTGNHQSSSLATSASTQSCSSRSHSPRGHSPNRERDSYSSNVSSLSRSSATPVSSQSSHLPLPPNLSPQLQSSSYSKAASWLSSVPGLSPVPRPTPPPSSAVGSSISGPLSLPPSSVASPFGGYPGVAPGHGLASPLPPVSSSMFAPPILPLSSISAHPSSQPPTFGPSTDPLYPGPTTSDMVRRDLESRLISGDRGVAGGPSPFLTRPSDLHPHHPLLPPLSGVGHLPPGAPTGPHPSHSSLFPPPLFKDLSKVGMDSPFYRTSMGLSYPGFNGILPPHGLATPFAPPTQLPAYTQKKTGKWNAMHVRIAWEIYQHQQKGTGADSSSKPGSSSSASSSKSVNPSSSAVGSSSLVSGLPTPPVSATSTGPSTSLAADLLRSSNHAFTGLSRAGEVPPFSAPMLSPHAPPPHASPRGTPYDPLFLNSAAAHLAPSLPRYPGFGALGPSFGGSLSGLGSSLLGRDLSSLVGLGQDQWGRFATRPPFPGAGNALGANWPVQRLDQRDSKTPTETRRPKESDIERPSRHSDSRESRESRDSRESRGRDSSPYRDRSPIRSIRTPHENGDGDSRSSRSNDSHSNSTSAVQSHSKSSRAKDDLVNSNGDRDKAPTPILTSFDRERIAQGQADKAAASLAASQAASRIYPPASPLNSTIPAMTPWDAYPGFLGAPPRISLGLLQLSERERELARIPPPPGRSAMFGNGPYGSLPFGAGPLQSVAPGSTVTTASSTKSSPLGGPIPLLNASIPPSPVSHSHLHSSQQQNGPNSPSAGKTQNQSEEKSVRTKEESHQSR